MFFVIFLYMFCRSFLDLSAEYSRYEKKKSRLRISAKNRSRYDFEIFIKLDFFYHDLGSGNYDMTSSPYFMKAVPLVLELCPGSIRRFDFNSDRKWPDSVGFVKA
jgi:hypothetical protein